MLDVHAAPRADRPERRTSLDDVWRFSPWVSGDPAPGPIAQVLRSAGEPLPASAARLAPGPHVDPTSVHIHTDEAAGEAAMMLGAAAFTAGSDIVFGPGQYQPLTATGQALLRHELGHVAQGGRAAPGSRPRMFESEVQETRASAGVVIGALGYVVQRHPAEKVLKFSAKWLSKRSAKHITKHIARHTRSIAGRSIHSVFRNPRQLKYMVGRALREATEVVERKAATLATHVVEEGSIRVIRQGTRSPGKYRYIVEKTFTRAIGTAGERVLRIVLDQTGRVVTAFPADRLLALGLTVAAVEAFTARTAEAAETVQASFERQDVAEAAANEPPESSWLEWVPIIGDLWGGELNAGESAWLVARDEGLRREKLIAEVVAGAVADMEADLQTTLGPEKRADVEEFVRMVLASGLDVAEPGEPDP